MQAFRATPTHMQRAESRYVRRYDICKNDCVLFWDSKHLYPPIRNAHRMKCPVCNADRYVTDPEDGQTRPAKVIFFFPLAPFIRGLFARDDLVPHLLQTASGRPEGDVVRSRGYKHKVYVPSSLFLP